ncbi:MAG: hypothetical protein ACQEWU_01770 [Bacillota bacterium]|uniref:Uncharacterized protein n=1 Tax=Virgibacillus salarius TaxID=447199 RepID=A0A941DZM5_9BACI|nr:MULTISPECIES: hypothetical protein [Bacillaceae]NAZ08976.1 hypothetical protein [Agaribacter marinus]MBR7796268.1 hypothetical protein [Virgibacillus salarius]MCC2248499.1 hypothetical protein [Virgibacillus sp. AGTR]MDY7043066.1 hypothetical protein [Virgibacillus sp. M23]QRZ16638.1 hypothetical protein JUJ52_12570 [Virgibacillus sp. AGTR]
MCYHEDGDNYKQGRINHTALGVVALGVVSRFAGSITKLGNRFSISATIECN